MKWWDGKDLICLFNPLPHLIPSGLHMMWKSFIIMCHMFKSSKVSSKKCNDLGKPVISSRPEMRCKVFHSSHLYAGVKGQCLSHVRGELYHVSGFHCIHFLRYSEKRQGDIIRPVFKLYVLLCGLKQVFKPSECVPFSEIAPNLHSQHDG